ncbi:hypothetical protein BAC2_03839 [uncultured bacterium]|nr:hypothetical protein BAC2_03839 [uncultured bacterium]
MDEQERRDLIERITRIKEMSETRQFFTPDNLDPSPDLEYCTVSRKQWEETYQVDRFDNIGLQSSRSDLSKSEVQAFLEDGNWELIAQSLTQKVGEGAVITRQYSRPKVNPS